MDIGLILAAVTEKPGLAMSLVWTVLPWLGVAAGLTFVIFVHELGHFLVAKACGVKCEKFYVGFDFFEIPIPFTPWKIPHSLIKFQWGETEYGLGSLPLGGYVKMLGQDDDPRNAEHEAARIRAAAPSAPEARVEAIASGTAAEGFVAGQSVEKLTNEALAHSPRPGGLSPAEPPVPVQTTEGKTILLDPRSYPAKSVPARMAIISAGVIMNLIFAVLLAALAFGLGVEEVPATIGATVPGSPAWVQGVLPGSKILQIGRRGQPFEHLRFEDLMTATVLNGYEREMPILVRGPEGHEVWYDIRPSDRLKSITKRPTIGVMHQASREVRIRSEAPEHLKPLTNPPLEDKDKILKIDGHELKTDWELGAILARKPTGPLTLTIERKVKQEGSQASAPEPPRQLDVVLQPQPMRDIGLVMEIGPIVAIRKGSPADDAGFEVGDVIRQVDGQPVGDPLSLSQRLLAKIGDSPSPMTFIVARKDRQGNEVERTLKATPELPLQSNTEFPVGGPVALESIGVAYDVKRTVANVTPGSSAEKAELAAGDVITDVLFVPANDAQKKIESEFLPKELLKPIVLDDNLKSWTLVFWRMQISLPDTQVKLTWKRGDKSHSATLPLSASPSAWDESRGLSLYGTQQIHRAAGVNEALQLGFREAVERVKEVVLILHSLLTGRVSATNLSGPAGIVYYAGGFASQGLPKLLIFLTMLSANLAVLNFLPIPALDGGHMLFLTAEGIRGKPVDERLQIRLTIAGVICLLSLMVFATAMDIGRFAEMIREMFG